jgi:multiple sugar transport system ATP-binding protein
MPRYAIHNLTKRFGRVTALDGVSLDAADGEFIVVLGPTGAGKTTLLRTVAGLEPADAGSITADGADVSSLAPAERDMAMVFQNFSLYPRLSVYDNLAFPLRPRWRRIPQAEIDRRVTWAAELLGLTPKLRSRPTELSGGQQQRVAIGRAIVREPQLFLFDEPLASLDAKLREQLAVEIHRLQRRLEVTMLYVTHDQTEAMSLADRVVVLDRGKVLQTGKPDEVYFRPNSPRVARMLGSPPINLLDREEASRLGIAPAPERQASAPAETFGLRPEHVALVPVADRPGRARVLVAEHLGPVTVLLLEAHGVRLRSTVPPTHPARFGDTYDLRVDPDNVLAWSRAGEDAP